MKYKTSQNEKKVNWDAENLALVARASSLLFFFLLCDQRSFAWLSHYSLSHSTLMMIIRIKILNERLKGLKKWDSQMNTVLKARYSYRHNTECFSVHVFLQTTKILILKKIKSKKGLVSVRFFDIIKTQKHIKFHE